MFRVILVAFLWTLTRSEEQYRLPDSIVPESYDLQIITYLVEENPFTFNGEVGIQASLNIVALVTLHKLCDKLFSFVYWQQPCYDAKN